MSIISENKLCINCKKEFKPLVLSRCQKCYVKYRSDQLPKKRCGCGQCLIWIPITTNQGRQRKYAQGHANKGKKHSEEHKQKIKAGYKPSKNTTISKVEKIIQKELDKTDILFCAQKGIRLDEFIHPVDFFIPPNVCIAIDGEKWHTQILNRGRIPIHQNYIIDSQLENRGYIVKRFWDHQVTNNLPWVMSQIFKTIGKNYRINEMIPCKCNCGKFRKQYDSQGNERFYINGHSGNHNDTRGRICHFCKTTKPSGFEEPKRIKGDWFIYGDNFICTRCYRKFMIRVKRWLKDINLNE